MYAKCGAIVIAKEVLEVLPVRDAVSWNALITGCVLARHSKKALESFEEMRHEGLSPTAVTYICILKACGSVNALDKGENIHHEIAQQGMLEENAALGGALVDMYAKCGAFTKAKEVLDGLSFQNVAAWNALIAGYVQGEYAKEALNCFERMQYMNLIPNAVTFACILKVCGSMGALEKGKQIHFEIIKRGLLDGNVVLGGSLVDMYAKCGALVQAEEVLEGLSIRDVVLWSALIYGYVQGEIGKEALRCFQRMKHEGIFPNVVTYICILKACGSTKAIDMGETLHFEIVRHGLLPGTIALGNALVDMYAKCGVLARAKEVCEELVIRDVITWNALITGYAQGEHGDEVLSCIEQMQGESIVPNAITFVCCLKACGSMGALDKGKIVHYEIVRLGLLGENSMVGNALVYMYAKCGAFFEAKEVFEELSVRNIVSWSALIAGYAQGDYGIEALECFEHMKCEGLIPDAFTFTCILKACGSIGALQMGSNLHSDILSLNFSRGNNVLGNAIVDMYAKCGALAKAKEVLEELLVRDAISWSALIMGHVHKEDGKEALNCYEQMQREGSLPDVVTFICILKACRDVGAIDKGKSICCEISRLGLVGGHDVLGNALVSMYADCDALAKAGEVIEELSMRDVVSWSALIAGYAQRGHMKEAVDCFKQMQLEGLQPDEIAYISVLNACNRSGSFYEGQKYFTEMDTNCHIVPRLEHYTCIVNLFGRLGLLDKAMALVKKVPAFSDLPLWFSLLTVSQKLGNAKLGSWAFECANTIGSQYCNFVLERKEKKTMLLHELNAFFIY